MRGNFELGVVVGMNSRSVLKGVRSSENGVCGFKCTLSGKLLLVGCEAGDTTPYLRAQVKNCRIMFPFFPGKKNATQNTICSHVHLA